MENIAQELRNLEAIYKFSERYTDPEVRMNTPYVVYARPVRDWAEEDYEDPGKP